MESLIFVIMFLFWIPIWAVRREVSNRQSPGYWRCWGAVVLSPTALQGRDHPIGSYMGVPIFEHVRFCNLDYLFERVARSEERDLIEGGELFLEPGLVYRLSDSFISQRS